MLKDLLDDIHDLKVVLVDLHLKIQSHELAEMAMRVRVFGPEKSVAVMMIRHGWDVTGNIDTHDSWRDQTMARQCHVRPSKNADCQERENVAS